MSIEASIGSLPPTLAPLRGVFKQLRWRVTHRSEPGACLIVRASGRSASIELVAGSLVATAVIVRHPWPRASEGRAEAVAAALTSVAWDGALDDPPHLWSGLCDARPLARLAEGDLAPTAAPDEVLARLVGSRTVSAGPGCLAWDALRFGRAVEAGGRALAVDELADLLPPALAMDPAHWRALGERFVALLGDPRPTGPLLDLDALRVARERRQAPEAPRRGPRSPLIRKGLKLLRSPGRFLADSRFGRRRR